MEKQTRDQNKETEAERERQIREDAKRKEAQPRPNVSAMEAVTRGAYGGGMYGAESGEARRKPPASETQSADGPAETAELRPKHAPPPSSGDRDVDITGQSYIQ